MSECDEGWFAPYKRCPFELANYCGIDGEQLPPLDTCPFATLLKALPDATEEILRIAEALLRGYGMCSFIPAQDIARRYSLGHGERKAGVMKPTCEKCGHDMYILYVENKQTITICPNCNYEILKSLPDASEQRIRFATLMLQGDGDMVEKEYPFTEEARRRIPVLGVKQEWHNFMPAEREKGGE